MLLSLRGRRKSSQPSFHNVIYLVTYIMIPLMAFLENLLINHFIKIFMRKLKQQLKKILVFFFFHKFFLKWFINKCPKVSIVKSLLLFYYLLANSIDMGRSFQEN